MTGKLREYSGGIVNGRVTSMGDQLVSITVRSQRERIPHRPGLKFDSMSGGNMGTSMDVVRKVGQFDESPHVVTAGDGDWPYRALKMGVPTMYAPAVTVAHLGWRQEADRAKQLASCARRHGGFYGKHLRSGDLFMLIRILIHHLRSLRRWIVGFVRRDDEQALIRRTYLRGLMTGIIAGWKGVERQL